MKTYHVVGDMVRPEMYGSYVYHVNQEIQAGNQQDAIDQFENEGWEFICDGLDVKCISEAEKMERASQPTLFPLPERGQ